MAIDVKLFNVDESKFSKIQEEPQKALGLKDKM